MKLFEARRVRITPMMRVRTLARQGNRILATLHSPYAEKDVDERLVDQVVVENGTLPLAELYFSLKGKSENRGEIDYRALIRGEEQAAVHGSQSTFRLYRIGDAVASRNIHAAIYDALRLCKDF
jgi:hypothetical protein